MDRVVVEAPASSANLGPGFDVFAVALEDPRDRVAIVVDREAPRSIRVRVRGAKGIPSGPLQNAAGAVAGSIMRAFRLKGGVTIDLTKRVPVGVGLGSSGASSAAAAFAMDRLFGLGMKGQEMVSHAGEGERAASGAAHLDNVAASLLGGFVIVRGPRLPPVRFNPPRSLSLVAVTPALELPARKTEYARSLIPKTVPTKDAVRNVAMASVMVAGFAKGDVKMIGEGMEDAVVEPARSRMVPGFDAVRRAAKSAGAAGVCMSGAGPSMLALVDEKASSPKEVLEAMVRAFRSEGVKAGGIVTKVGEGARIV